jgi:hypothetical protein
MRRAVLLSLLLALPAVPAHADPIVFITGGSLDLVRVSPGQIYGPLVLQGTHSFSVKGLAVVSGTLGFNCFLCAPGHPVELGGGTAELFGKAMVDGVLANPFEQLDLAFGIGFDSPTLPAPPIGPEAVLSAPFIVHGSVSGFDLPQPYEIVGRGTAVVHLVADEFVAGVWTTDRAHYEFANATPEPTSFALLGTGLLGLLVRTRRRRTRGSR